MNGSATTLTGICDLMNSVSWFACIALVKINPNTILCYLQIKPRQCISLVVLNWLLGYKLSFLFKLIY